MMKLQRAFTLVEVNLAIFIMAVGILAMVSLYSLGFRESRQSEEDVAAAGYADAVFAPLVAALSSTEMTWTDWCSIGDEPHGDSSGGKGPKDYCDGVTQGGEGWNYYVQKPGGSRSARFRVKNASGFHPDLTGILGKANDGISRTLPTLPGDLSYALVATRCGGTIGLAFRCSRRKDLLLSQPVYYTEVHFQGRSDK